MLLNILHCLSPKPAASVLGILLLSQLSLFAKAAKTASLDSEDVHLIQYSSGWAGDELEVCEVTGFQVRPTSTCGDFSLGQLLEEAEELAAAKPSKWSKCHQKVQLQALKGETESAQLLFRMPSTLSQQRSGTTLTFDHLHAFPPGVDCELFQVGFVYTNASGRVLGSGGGWRPDPIRSLKSPGASVGLAENLAQPLLLSCAVQEHVFAGHYEAELRLSLKPGRSVCVGISLDVLNATIPSLEESKTGSAWRGLWRSEAFEPYYGEAYWEKNKKAWFDLMLAHRTPPDMVNPRPLDDLAYLTVKGTKWLGVFNVAPYASKKISGCPSYSAADIEKIIDNIKPIMTLTAF